MRDTTIARRALLALAAGALICGWPADPALSRPRSAHRRAKADPKPRRRPRTVAIDAGHGGIDPGTISPRGIQEKTVTLATARALQRQLQGSGRYRAVLTRSRDTLIPLRERVARARRHRADLFLSIHADAVPDSTVRGVSVYTLSERASDRETASLVLREPKDQFLPGVKLSAQPPVIGAILLDLARQQTNNRSIALARSIVEEVGGIAALLPKPHRSAGFAVLSAPDIPSALVEIGCLSNPEEERLLPTRAYQRRLAQALARAIDDYFAGARRI
jgi:N-acetylmuramoyl-L-alanine amidase